MRLTLATVQQSIQPASPLNYQVTQTLQDLSAAANSVQELAEMLHRNPTVLVRGRYVPEEHR
jgi:paraquat-inducible protein B